MPNTNLSTPMQDPWSVVAQTPAPQTTATPAPASSPASPGSDPWAVVAQAPAQSSQPQDIGVLAGVKRNTIGAVEGVYHALTDPVTPEETVSLRQKIDDYNNHPDVQAGKLPKMSTESAENPSRAALAYHRIIDAPAATLLKKGKDEVEAARDLLSNHEYWRGGNLYLSGLADKALSIVPAVGPAISQVAERYERGDASGAATDVAAMIGSEYAPEVLGKTAKGVGKLAETVAPESMNALLRAGKQSNYLYGKNPGRAFIDEGIKIPKNSITLGGQLENLHGQLEIAQDNLTAQLKTALSEPSVAAKRIDIVPGVKSAIADAKKFVSKQTGLDVPKYTDELTKLEDSILTRYDSQGNPTGKITGTKLSPSEVADVKKSLGKNTQWRVLPTDPEIQLKTYLNGVRKKIYGQLADTVQNAAPNADVKALNQRLANSIEAQGLLEKRIAYEHGTGGWAAAARHFEVVGGLASLLNPATAPFGAAAIADRVVRSVPGKMATAKGLDALGDSLQSGVGQDIARGIGRSTIAAPAVAGLPHDEGNEE
jgi:hypothetical protein